MIEVKKNIVLIGMPGCGKTTIGKELSNMLNLEFCDIDEYIVTTQGKQISEIFENGEEHFREIETKAVEEVSKTFPKIVSTGGGAVKRVKNIEILRENGIIIFINRPIENIASDVDIKSRPLLKKVQKSFISFMKKDIRYMKLIVIIKLKTLIWKNV
jgi:Shikimate kinase